MNVIRSVVAEASVIDSLSWTVALQIDIGVATQRVFIPKWNARMVFHKNEMTPVTMPPRGPEVLELRAIWSSDVRDSRWFSRIDRNVEFRTELAGDAVERIERFRCGGPLFVRLESQAQVLVLPQGDAAEIASAIATAYTDPGRVIWVDVLSESLDARDIWLRNVIAVLRPPGRVLLEVAVPSCITDEPNAHRALAALEKADSEFSIGRYEEVANHVYKALEALQPLLHLVSSASGDMVRGRIKDQGSALAGIANEVRHDEAKLKRAVAKVDRALAQHLLISAKSLAAVIMRP